MNLKLIKVLDDLRASYWFVPLCMLFAAISLAVFAVSFDADIRIESYFHSPFVVASGPEDARTILSLVAAAVMGVAGVTFSITIVAVSFASSNFGPRLIGNFMRDRGNQFTLGSFIGTFAYCLIVLASVHGISIDANGATLDPFVPHTGVIIALLLAIACIGVLIYYFHHVTESINIEKIVASIGNQLKLRIVDIYPNSNDANSVVDETRFSEIVDKHNPVQICCESIGYVQAINHKELVDLTKSHQLLTRVHYRPGDFITPHDCLLSIWSEAPGSIPEDELRRCFVTGAQRTEHQNVLFLVEQLAEVIARALSPGVNDPFTAISCLNWYYLAILEYVKAYPEAIDEKSMSRRIVQVRPITFERLTSVMFDTSRQYIVSDTNVLLHAMAILTQCAWHSGSEIYQQNLINHLTEYHEAARKAHSCSVEIRTISERFEQSIAILADPGEPSANCYEKPWFGGSA